MIDPAVETTLEIFASNQRRFIASLAPNRALDLILARYGPRWVDILCDAIIKAGRSSILFDIVPVQPFTQPVGVIYYRPDPGELADAPGGLRTQEVMAETRKMRAGFPIGGSFLDDFVGDVYSDKDSPHPFIPAFEEAWSELEREVLSMMLSPTKDAAPTIISRHTVAAGLDTLVASVGHPHCDALLINPKTLALYTPQLPGLKVLRWIPDTEVRPTWAALLDNRIRVYVDGVFPEDQVMAFRRKKSPHDKTLVWSPYLFAGDMFTEAAGCHFRLRFRGKITMLSDSFVAHGIFD